MNMKFSKFKSAVLHGDIDSKKHKPQLEALQILKYIGPGLLVTVGFIDPGNWASNIAAGDGFVDDRAFGEQIVP